MDRYFTKLISRSGLYQTMLINNVEFAAVLMCGSRKYPYMYSLHGRSLEIPRGMGVLNAKLL